MGLLVPAQLALGSVLFRPLLAPLHTLLPRGLRQRREVLVALPAGLEGTLGVGELTLSARPSVGLGHRTRGRDDFLIGGAIGASAALRVVGSITSYLVPAIGAGTILGDSDAPIRVHPMIGGGVRSTWESLDAVLGIGFQRVVARGSHTVFGATFSIAIEAP